MLRVNSRCCEAWQELCSLTNRLLADEHPLLKGMGITALDSVTQERREAMPRLANASSLHQTKGLVNRHDSRGSASIYHHPEKAKMPSDIK